MWLAEEPPAPCPALPRALFSCPSTFSLTQGASRASCLWPSLPQLLPEGLRSRRLPRIRAWQLRGGGEAAPHAWPGSSSAAAADRSTGEAGISQRGGGHCAVQGPSASSASLTISSSSSSLSAGKCRGGGGRGVALITTCCCAAGLDLFEASGGGGGRRTDPACALSKPDQFLNDQKAQERKRRLPRVLPLRSSCSFLQPRLPRGLFNPT